MDLNITQRNKKETKGNSGTLNLNRKWTKNRTLKGKNEEFEKEEKEIAVNIHSQGKTRVKERKRE